MISQQQGDRNKEDAPIPTDTLTIRIGRHVVQTLGTPADLLKVRVHPLGNDRYRVNVLVGKTYATARITDSFFLTSDGEGNIVTSSPKIVKLY